MSPLDSADRYPFRDIEAKWPKGCEETNTFSVCEDRTRPVRSGGLMADGR